MVSHSSRLHKTTPFRLLLCGLLGFSQVSLVTKADAPTASVTLNAFHPPPFDDAGCPVWGSDVVLINNYRLFTRPQGRFQPSVYQNVIARDFQRSHDEFLSLRVLTLTDGSIRLIAGGFASHAANPGNESHEDFLLIRYYPVGVIDRRFATEGVFIRDFAGGADRIWDIQPLGDGTGRFLVAGSAWNAVGNGTSKDMVLMLFSENGEPDRSFGENGVVIRDISKGDDEILATVLLQVNGQQRIMAAGYATDNNNRNRILLSYTLDGQPLTGCGEQGYILGSDSGNNEYRALQLLTLPDNSLRVLAAGYRTGNVNGRDFLMGSFLPDCEPDTGFGHNGEVVRNLAVFDDFDGEYYSHDEVIGAIQVVSNGDQEQILVAGISKRYLSDDVADIVDHLIISRYWGNGTLDETFANNGDALLDVFHPLHEPMTLEVITLDNGDQHIISGKYGRPFCSADDSVLVSLPPGGDRFNDTLLAGSLRTDFFHFGEASAAVRGIVNVTLSDGSRHIIIAGYGFGAIGTDCACTTQKDVMLASFTVTGEQSACFGANATVLGEKEECAHLLAGIDIDIDDVDVDVDEVTDPPVTPVNQTSGYNPPLSEQEANIGAVVGLSVVMALSLAGNIAQGVITGCLLYKRK